MTAQPSSFILITDMDSTQSSRLIAHCPLCQSVYPDDRVHLVGERGGRRLFHYTCRGCGHAMLAIILESKGSISSIGLMTDLEAHDADRIHEAPPISADDCIRAHRILQDDSVALATTLLRNE